MKNIYSNIYSFNKRVLQKTVKILKDAELVGLPTETVYGLAGNAYSKKALKKIFLLKKRPKKRGPTKEGECALVVRIPN